MNLCLIVALGLPFVCFLCYSFLDYINAILMGRVRFQASLSPILPTYPAKQIRRRIKHDIEETRDMFSVHCPEDESIIQLGNMVLYVI